MVNHTLVSLQDDIFNRNVFYYVLFEIPGSKNILTKNKNILWKRENTFFCLRKNGNQGI